MTLKDIVWNLTPPIVVKLYKKIVTKDFLYIIYMKLTSFLGPFHYRILGLNIPFSHCYIRDGILGNICYGNTLAVKNALHDDFDKHCMIEHGVYFGRYVIEHECENQNVNTIYTYGQYRIDVLKNYFGSNFQKKIIPIGPYICYADNFYSKRKLISLKEKLGKILLVFPSHTSFEASLDFNYDEWINEIKRCAKEFDTVIISLFWMDIKNGNYKKYLNKGFLLTCNGNRMDYHFLSREKDLIMLADSTMSNDIGTHIGYCIAMEKPHYIYHQNITATYLKGTEDNDETSMYRAMEYKEIFDCFNSFDSKITQKQKDLVKYYWGNYE